ncbi:MAG: hypothetical protein SV062_12965 [Thermodesulfobacteriota bacterium]|nr:hypothetical protein [Thermodesulfobacteriota bacterium]
MIIRPKHYEDLVFESGPSFIQIRVPEKITPRVFWEYSIADLESGSDSRHNINALANAKRSLHMLVDILSRAFGIDNLKTRKKANFPSKLRFCRDCGLTSPAILRKINKLRNITEHEYFIPKRSDVEDYVDIVELFLSANEGFLNQFPAGDMDWTFLAKTDDSLPDILGCDFPPYEGVIYLWQDRYQRKNSIEIKVQDKEPYFEWVQFIVNNCH